MTCRAAFPTSSIGMRLLHAHAHTALSWGHAARRRSQGKWSKFSYGTLSPVWGDYNIFLQLRLVVGVVGRVGEREV